MIFKGFFLDGQKIIAVFLFKTAIIFGSSPNASSRSMRMERFVPFYVFS